MAPSRRTAFLRAVFLLMVLPLSAQQKATDFAQLSLEELMNVEVTSVSKRAQKISDTAAAVFVITRDDIRRSGATRIPDLLRMVPGLQVAQINGNAWAIGARGLNEHFSDKLMVMLDDRRVYTDTFSGVYWDTFDVPLEDIERIEVIRGPGGSSWGTNAVNGVINIITKHASQTHGGLVVAGAGNLEQGFGLLQYGGQKGKHTDYRVFTKYFHVGQLAAYPRGEGADQWQVFRAGFRADTSTSARDEISLRGDIYRGSEGQYIPQFQSMAFPYILMTRVEPTISGGYLQAAWTRHTSSRGEWILQGSYDHYRRGGLLDERRDTFDLDIHQHLMRARHDIVWGAGFRNSDRATGGSLTIRMNPAGMNENMFSAFVQDEITLLPNRLSFSIGSKLEHNVYTGFGVMPSGRVLWKLNQRTLVWSAISRGIRTPATFDAAIHANLGGFIDPSGLPVVIRLLGNSLPTNETMLSREVGVRSAISNRLTIDLAGFYNTYGDLVSVEPGLPFIEEDPSPPHLVAPLTVKNLQAGETHGVEIFANWKVTERWSLLPSYAWERIHLHRDPRSQDFDTILKREGNTPHHWSRLESQLSLPHHVSWTVSAGFVDQLTASQVPSYVRVDSQLSWTVKERLSLSLVGQNLNRPQHVEFIDFWNAVYSSWPSRNAYVKLAWTF